MQNMMRKYPFLSGEVRRSLLVGIIGWIVLVAAFLFVVRSAGAAGPGNLRPCFGSFDSATCAEKSISK